jgi:hypothetical protein
MKRSAIVKIILGLIILSAVTVGILSIDHPIILKWVTGSARHYGRSIDAAIYTNEQVNDRIRIFYSDEPNNYLLSIRENDSSEVYNFFNLNIQEKWIGRPVNISERDYDFIMGHLFINKSVEHFSPIKDETKVNNFDPQLTVINKQIKFNMPLNNFRIASVRIQLP